jgi:carbonic anhydrase
MKKVFHFDSPREKYTCDAAIVSCFDNRFQLGFAKYFKKVGIVNSDPIKIAGGAKSLASPDRDGDREFLLEQIRKSIRLHDTRRVILTLHSDCGAYGGLDGAFGGDELLEERMQAEEMRRAAACLRSAVPDITVEGYFANFEGIWEVDLTKPVLEARPRASLDGRSPR